MKLSKPNQLIADDVKKILIGAGVAALGAFFTYLAQYLSNQDFGEFTPLVVALCSVIVNALRKWGMETKYK